MEEIITSKQNSIVKLVKSLHQKKYREAEGKYFIEGIKILEEAISENVVPVEILICKSKIESIKSGTEFLKLLKDKGIKPKYISDSVLNEISDTENPQGVVAVINSTNSKSLKIKNDGFYLILDSLQDPGNMGTILRTADAVGVDGVIISEGCVDPYSPKVLRATMGSIFRMNILKTENIVQFIKKMKTKKIKVIASSLRANDFYSEVDYSGGIGIVIGNEANGISEEITKISDILVKIPIRGRTESLNAAVAAGILMYEAIKNKE